MTDSFYAGGGIGLGPRPAVAEREPYPAPVVSSRDGVAGPDKKAVRDLARLAQAYCWTVEITYAEGCFPNAVNGSPGAVKPSLAVRMERGREFAVAVYVGGSVWSWDTLRILRGGRIERRQQIGEFLDALFGAVQTQASWHPPYVRSWR